MPASVARIPTDRASRYLTQLCRHTAQLSHLGHRGRHGTDAGATMPRGAECSDDDGVITFDNGRCTLHATGEELVLRAEAADPRVLRLMQEAIAARLQRIGGRDQLSVTWRPGPAQPDSGEG
jgi:hypothetical protein